MQYKGYLLAWRWTFTLRGVAASLRLMKAEMGLPRPSPLARANKVRSALSQAETWVREARAQLQMGELAVCPSHEAARAVEGLLREWGEDKPWEHREPRDRIANKVAMDALREALAPVAKQEAGTAAVGAEGPCATKALARMVASRE